MSKDTSASDVDEALVLRLAACVGLELTPDQLPEVTANLRRTLALAREMTSVTLEPSEEAAPIWRP